MTGFQSKGVSMEDLKEMVISSMDSGNLEIHFMQRSLRSAKDIYEKGGTVTPKLEEKTFRLNFDNRRQVVTGVSPFIQMKPPLLLTDGSESNALTGSGAGATEPIVEASRLTGAGVTEPGPGEVESIVQLNSELETQLEDINNAVVEMGGACKDVDPRVILKSTSMLSTVP